MLNQLIDFLFPQKSLTGEEGAFITPDEMQRIRLHPSVDDRAQLRRAGLKYLDCIRASVQYESSPLIHRAVHALKYKRMPGLAEFLGELIVSGCGEEFGIENLEFGRRSIKKSTFQIPQAVLCPVPLHWSRRFWRGFNQAELLADIVGSMLKIPVLNLLVRKRPTGHQARRSRKERLTALQYAFKALDGVHVHTNVILIDDLATTGATLDECAGALKESGVGRVEGWVVARG